MTLNWATCLPLRTRLTQDLQSLWSAGEKDATGFQGEEEKYLQAMLKAGVITPSASEWAAPVVFVHKKDGGVQWSVDYHCLNSLRVKDAYTLPKIEECLDDLGGATMFSTLDLQFGYWQIAVDDKDHEKTAFITKWGFYEYTGMPFGLCNDPSTFQRIMELVLGRLEWETLLIYLDDVIVLGRGVDESLDGLAQVFSCLHSYGLKPSKCYLAVKRSTQTQLCSGMYSSGSLLEMCRSCRLSSGCVITTASLSQHLQNWHPTLPPSKEGGHIPVNR